MLEVCLNTTQLIPVYQKLSEYFLGLFVHELTFDKDYGFYGVEEDGTIQKIDQPHEYSTWIHRYKQYCLYLPCGQLTVDPTGSVSYKGTKRCPASIMFIFNDIVKEDPKKYANETKKILELCPSKLVLNTNEFISINECITKYDIINDPDFERSLMEAISNDNPMFLQFDFFIKAIEYGILTTLNKLKYSISGDVTIRTHDSYIAIVFELKRKDNNNKYSCIVVPFISETMTLRNGIIKLRISIYDESPGIIESANFQGTKPIKKETV